MLTVSCRVCGQQFTAQRRTAKYCSKRCSNIAFRSRALMGGDHEPPSVAFRNLSYDELAEVVQRAHMVTDDMSRAAMHSPEPLGGMFRRCAAAFADALRSEGL